MRVAGGSMESLITGLAQQLLTLRDLLQSRDLVAIADALLYEWPDTAAAWAEALGVICDHVENRGPRA